MSKLVKSKFETAFNIRQEAYFYHLLSLKLELISPKSKLSSFKKLVTNFYECYVFFGRLLREDILQKLTAVQQGVFLSQSLSGRGRIITQRLQNAYKSPI